MKLADFQITINAIYFMADTDKRSDNYYRQEPMKKCWVGVRNTHTFN